MFDQEAIDSRARSMVEAMQDQLEARTRAGENLARIAAYLDEIRAQYAAAYKDALKAGWSDQELKKLGVPAPAKTGKARGKQHSKTGQTLEANPPTHIDGEGA